MGFQKRQQHLLIPQSNTSRQEWLQLNVATMTKAWYATAAPQTLIRQAIITTNDGEYLARLIQAGPQSECPPMADDHILPIKQSQRINPRVKRYNATFLNQDLTNLHPRHAYI